MSRINIPTNQQTKSSQYELAIKKLLSSFLEAAFICYDGSFWMNKAMCQLLACDDKNSITAVVPSDMHHLLSRPGSHQFELTLNGDEASIVVNALITPYSIHQLQVSLGLIIDQHNNTTNSQSAEIAKIDISSKNDAFEKHRASVTLEAISDGIISLDPHGFIDYINGSAELMLGIDADNAIDKKLNEVIVLKDSVSGTSISPSLNFFKHSVAAKDHATQLMLKHQASGHYSPVEIYLSVIEDDKQNIEGNVLVIHDISDLYHMSEQIIFQAKHDTLTGLFNRGEFERQLSKTLDETRKEKQSHIMCYIDLDQFKIVNDTCGHLAGDELLRQISSQIKSHTKDRDIVARLGGDEFGILLRDCDLSHARQVTERIRQSVKSHRFKWENKIFHIGASIGVMTIDEHAGTLDDVLSMVDAACYKAKKSGRDQINFISENDTLIQQRHNENICIEQIKHALDNDCFQLYSQTISALDNSLDDDNHQELLLRMLTENEQVLEPKDFMQTAHRHHMMPAIDRWVIQHALRRLSDSEDPLNNEKIKLTCINISSQSLADVNFANDVILFLRNSNINSNDLCFEISEADVASNITKASEFMFALSAHGVRFSLDNFCNSLSSFSYIKKLPIDFLKIDGRFMRNLIEDEVDIALISAIRDLTNILGIQTIAESVEDQYTFTALKTLGIDYAQGFFIAQPKDLLQQYEQCLAPSLNIH